MWISRTLRAVALVAAGAAAGCTTSDQEAPALSGPSEFGQSISVTATPDRLSQDGVSQARVEATVRDAEGKPAPGVTVQWSVAASTGVLVEPSAQQSTTDGQGRAAMFVTAPPPPAFVPSYAATLTITANAGRGRCDQHDEHAGRSWCNWCRPLARCCRTACPWRRSRSRPRSATSTRN